MQAFALGLGIRLVLKAARSTYLMVASAEGDQGWYSRRSSLLHLSLTVNDQRAGQEAKTDCTNTIGGAGKQEEVGSQGDVDYRKLRTKERVGERTVRVRFWRWFCKFQSASSYKYLPLPYIAYSTYSKVART